jgi:hypothetical protein
MSSSNLTLGVARQQLYRFSSTPNDPTSSECANDLNLVCERFSTSGKWKGNVVDCIFDSSSGYITLPYELQSILAVCVRNCPEVVFGEFQTFITTGPGKLKFDQQNQGLLVDWGGDVPTMVSPDPRYPATIKLTIAKAADAGKVLRIYGKHSNGEEFVDADGVRGITITSVFPTVTTTLVAKEITGVELPDGKIGNWYLYGTVDGVDTLYSRYYPFETIPNYKRYITQTIQDSADSNIYPTIGLKCLRRFFPAIADTDFLWPDSLGALKFGLQALQYENTGNDESATICWNKGFKELDDQTRASRGSGMMPIPFAPFGPGNRTLINTW